VTKFYIQTKLDEAFVDETDLFKDKFVFHENYEPDVIYHRDMEMAEIIHFFKMIKDGRKGNLDISGPTGTGKTLIIKKVMHEFIKRLGDKKIKVVYINCSEFDTKAKIIKKLACELSNLNVSWGAGLRTIDRELEKLDNVLVILDEVDKVLRKDGDSIFYILASRGKISLINISNVVMWRRYITDQRVTSRMQPNQILFNPYSAGELFNILKQRAEKGLKEGAYTDEIIATISHKIAYSSGDMRKALDMLMRSAEYAQLMKKDRIDMECVNFVEKRQEVEVVIDFIRNLPPPKQLILVIIFDFWERYKDYPTVEEVKEEYNKLIRRSEKFRPLLLETTRVYLYELATYELVERIGGKGLGKGKGRSPQKYKLNIDEDLFRREIYHRLKSIN